MYNIRAYSEVPGHRKTEWFRAQKNTYEELVYLRNKLGDNPHHDLTNGGVDYTIYPGEGFIPICSVCRNSIETATAETAIMPHLLCGCLWADFAIDRIHMKHPNAIIVRNKDHVIDRKTHPAYILGCEVAKKQLKQSTKRSW